MNLKKTSKFITLDWDNINLHEALSRCNEISLSPNVSKIRLDRSCTKGYHCRIWFYYPVRVVDSRFALGDDPRRILHDLLNRPDYIHDILWKRKTISDITYETKRLITIE